MRCKCLACAAILALAAAGADAADGLALAADGKALADVLVEARGTYDLNASVQDLLDHLRKMTGANFVTVKVPKKGSKLIRLANDPSLGEQETLVRVSERGVELLGSDHVEYAVYDFLKYFCGCEWLDPTEAGEIVPRDANLTVRFGERRDRPYCLARRNSGVFTTYNPLLWRDYTPGWTNYVKTAYPAAWAKGGVGEAVKEMNFFRTRFKRRMKAQGRNATANHSFYWFNDRFLNPKNENFIRFRPELFAKGYHQKETANRNPEDIYSDWNPRIAPPQMCYTEPALVEQTLVDVRAYFDHGGYTNRYTNQGQVCDAMHPAPIWGADTYCLEPHDNECFCRCARCTKEYRPDRAAERGVHSDYWFRFVNTIAKEIKKSHPGRKISTLAYGSGREAPPTFELEDNVVVHFCYSCNRMPNTATKLKQENLFRTWHAKYPKMHMGAWLYNCFPQERTSRPGGFNCFPGFFGRMLADEYRFLKEMQADEIIFNCGMTDDFESFLTFRLMWSPDEDYDALKNEWFAAFGAAAEPIRAFYDAVEARFCDLKNYPEKSGHQTPLVAWGFLGTEPVMDRLAALMAEAEAKADTPLAKARVANWKAGVWEYMREGKCQEAFPGSGREGVSVKVTTLLGERPKKLVKNQLLGKPASATAAGLWNAIGAKAERYALKDLGVFTDGDYTTDAWMNGHPTTDLVVRVEGPVKGLSRLRVTLRYSDFLRSRAILVPVGFRDGKVVELGGEVRLAEQPNPNWKVLTPDCRCWKTVEWTFAEGSVPAALDAVGIVDRGIREKWYAPPIAEIEGE